MAVRNHFLVDAVIVVFGVVVGTFLRFPDSFSSHIGNYVPGALMAAAVMPALAYGMGLYSIRVHLRRRYRLALLAVCYGGAILIMLVQGSLNFDARLGRGVLLLSVPVTIGLLVLHHGILVKRSLGSRDRILVMVSDEMDLLRWKTLKDFNPPHVQLVGIVDATTGPSSGIVLPMESVSGHMKNLPIIAKTLSIDSVLCTRSHLRNPLQAEMLRKVSFSGARLVRLIDVMEDAYRMVPVELVDMEWLMMTSTIPHRAYVRKWKRLTDIIFSSVVGVVALPILLLGMLWVKIASPEGPVFFRQIRIGFLGRRFEVLKLRTMRIDAEAQGAQWAQKKDPRVFPGGGFLRKFRIDEIPQLLNIFRGEMGFVGPRPERPEFEDKLAAEVPFFRERLHVLPGLTGWAQVNYPYGATVEDTRRKLAYDLYYMKHMTLTLDLFILLDTVRIVLGEGVQHRKWIGDSVKELMAAHEETPPAEVPAFAGSTVLSTS